MNRFRRPSEPGAGPGRHHGLAAGLSAYVLWGFLPLLFHALRAVPPFELVSWRVVFTVPVCLAFIAATRSGGDLLSVLKNRRVLLRLMLSAVLIGSNWTLFVAAVASGHVLATSLGYYINPLINVLIGTLFLGEKLGWRQWAAVAIAATGIALLLGGAIETLSVALTLAVTFALYGLVRKLTPVKAIVGLTVETLALLPLAMGYAFACTMHPGGSSLARGGLTATLLASSGLATAVPLLLFAMAARKLAFSTLGFLQYAAPTISFLLGILVLGEHLDPLKLACFVLIWTAIGLFSWDAWRRQRAIAA
ncbi:rarD protein [Novosphingobium nitrogenifigens DSM 19370]|uniref:RarD protein n=1 Tax=Novosphingobium nitrogenifigens DSM 19370 TaxID=983920 RepID=F1Z6W8_9SPHN|nr:EamA family transporter RarD [Novosphingobium nitrogenifigens]EGD59778.1 rarD protein [Novosphingobium nitrogenifigens DSM 19370]